MDPVSVTVVTALAGGAMVAGKTFVTEATKDAYAALKNLIKTRYAKLTSIVDDVETDPNAEGTQKYLAEKLDQAGADQDDELKTAAVTLLDEIEKLPREKIKSLVNVERMRAAKNIKLARISATNTAINVEDMVAGGDIEITDVHQTGGGHPPKH
ncbi:MAG: hypothetical protein ACFB6S_07060 [Geminicoccaceae bacterium]